MTVPTGVQAGAPLSKWCPQGQRLARQEPLSPVPPYSALLNLLRPSLWSSVFSGQLLGLGSSRKDGQSNLEIVGFDVQSQRAGEQSALIEPMWVVSQSLGGNQQRRLCPWPGLLELIWSRCDHSADWPSCRASRPPGNSPQRQCWSSRVTARGSQLPACPLGLPLLAWVGKASLHSWSSFHSRSPWQRLSAPGLSNFSHQPALCYSIVRSWASAKWLFRAPEWKQAGP